MHTSVTAMEGFIKILMPKVIMSGDTTNTLGFHTFFQMSLLWVSLNLVQFNSCTIETGNSKQIQKSIQIKETCQHSAYQKLIQTKIKHSKSDFSTAHDTNWSRA